MSIAQAQAAACQGGGRKPTHLPMWFKTKSILAAFGVLLAVSGEEARAQQLVFGLGLNDYTRHGTDDALAFSAEYLGVPRWRPFGSEVGLGAALVGHSDGPVFAGGGVVWTHRFGRHWFVEGSLMPGLYSKAGSETDLGSNIQFRSILAVGRGNWSATFGHFSNGRLGSYNPGTNAFFLRWHAPLDRP